MVPPARSVLALRHADDQSIELLAHRNLTRQARIEFGLSGKAEHARLLRRQHWRTGRFRSFAFRRPGRTRRGPGVTILEHQDRNAIAAAAAMGAQHPRKA
jgi:hypothetical protein